MSSPGTDTATLEEDLLLHEELIDLYMYYTTIALGMPSPALRAAAISVLVLLVPQNPEQGEFSAVVRRVLLGCFSSRPHVSI